MQNSCRMSSIRPSEVLSVLCKIRYTKSIYCVFVMDILHRSVCLVFHINRFIIMHYELRAHVFGVRYQQIYNTHHLFMLYKEVCTGRCTGAQVSLLYLTLQCEALCTLCDGCVIHAFMMYYEYSTSFKESSKQTTQEK